jgi:shikimate dehydrogenase
MSLSPDLYAVFGHPIGHSQSPRIHSLFAEQTGQDLKYEARDVDLPQFEAAVRAFLGAEGGRGLNCTLPLKEAAWRLADSLSDRARRAQAVNTLALRPDGSLFGDNTDGAGLLRDLMHRLGVIVRNGRILVVGAGGAARGILAPLLGESPTAVVIANRTVERARTLAGDFSDRGSVLAVSFDELPGRHFDLVINASAASLSGDLPPLPEDLLAPGACCYDLAYGTEPTPFLRWGQARGARISADGLGMLVEQAAEAFELWRGVRPDSRSVIERLSEERGF